MTEHGVLPPECGVNDDAAAWQLNPKSEIRKSIVWRQA
jgi:hypothetical protein